LACDVSFKEGFKNNYTYTVFEYHLKTWLSTGSIYPSHLREMTTGMPVFGKIGSFLEFVPLESQIFRPVGVQVPAFGNEAFGDAIIRHQIRL